jgi:hypothetical protein
MHTQSLPPGIANDSGLNWTPFILDYINLTLLSVMSSAFVVVELTCP